MVVVVVLEDQIGVHTHIICKKKKYAEADLRDEGSETEGGGGREGEKIVRAARW